MLRKSPRPARLALGGWKDSLPDMCETSPYTWADREGFPGSEAPNAALDTRELACRRGRELRARRAIRRRHLPGVDALRPRWRTPHAGSALCAGGPRHRAPPTATSAGVSLPWSDVHLHHLAPLLRPPLTEEMRVADRDLKPLIGRVLHAVASSSE